MIYRLIILALLAMPIYSQAQSITIKNESQTKTFDQDTYYELVFSDDNIECCFTRVGGKIQRVLKDSLQIKVNDIALDNKDLDFMLKMYGNIYEQNLLISFPKSELQIIQPYKNKKSKDKKETISTIGGVLLFTGIATLANSYDLDAKSFRKGVLISGAAQIGIGIVGVSLGSKKKYHASDGWRF